MVFEGALLRQTHGSGPVMAMARTLDLPDGCDVAGAISRSNGRDGGKAETDRIFSMLLNAALYLTSRAPDVEPERKVSDLLREGLEGRGAAVRRRFAPRIASSGERTLFRVGENLPPIVFSGPAPGQGPDDATPGGGGRLTRRFLVRGHWRNQAHGPGMALRRPVFIEPFEKGPDIGDTINRPFLVDDDGRDVGFDPGLQTTLFDPSS